MFVFTYTHNTQYCIVTEHGIAKVTTGKLETEPTCYIVHNKYTEDLEFEYHSK